MEGLFTPVIHFSTGLTSIIQKIAGPLIPATTSAVDQLVVLYAYKILTARWPTSAEDRKGYHRILMPNNAYPLSSVALVSFVFHFSFFIFPRFWSVRASENVAEFKCSSYFLISLFFVL